MPYYCMYGVYDGLDAARACRLGPDELVTPDARCVKALTRWSDALARTSGTTALASVYPSRRPATTGVLHVMHSDAALKGTKYPAICRRNLVTAGRGSCFLPRHRATRLRSFTRSTGLSSVVL